MANSQVQRKAEKWVCANWLPEMFGQPFRKQLLPLEPGGDFEFDAVSGDGKIVVCISTNCGVTASGGKASPKLHKIRADALFLSMLVDNQRRVIVFTDKAMYDLCDYEVKNGRFPLNVEIVLAQLPPDLELELQQARAIAAAEVMPRTIVS